MNTGTAWLNSILNNLKTPDEVIQAMPPNKQRVMTKYYHGMCRVLKGEQYGCGPLHRGGYDVWVSKNHTNYIQRLAFAVLRQHGYVLEQQTFSRWYFRSCDNNEFPLMD